MALREVPEKRQRSQTWSWSTESKMAGEEGGRRDPRAEVGTEGIVPLLGKRRTVLWNYEPVCNLF